MELFHFESDGLPLAAAYHPPLRGSVPDCGIVLCHPMGQEQIRSHRALLQLAELCSGAGFPVLRFDLRGCGDSCGDHRIWSIRGWESDLRRALEEIKSAVRVDRLRIVGLRLGALLAFRVAQDHADVDAVVLWDPILDGRAFLEELRRAHRVWVEHSFTEPHRRSANGESEFESLGFPLTTSFIRELSETRFGAVATPRNRRVLAIGAVDETQIRKAMTADETPGFELTVECASDPPVWVKDKDELTGCLVPKRTLERIVAWLGADQADPVGIARRTKTPAATSSCPPRASRPPEQGALWASNVPPRFYETMFSREHCIVEGSGVRLRDAAGRWYIDARSSLWDATLGYGHAGMLRALQEQSARLGISQTARHTRPSEVALKLADELVARLPKSLNHVRFGSTGSQMVDAAVLFSRALRRLDRKADRTAIIALEDGYHGMGGGPSALTCDEMTRNRLGPLMGDVHQVPLRSEEDLADVIEQAIAQLGADRVSAVVLEPVLGAGIRILPETGLRRVQSLCREAGIHLIMDEIATGCGRLGTWNRSGALGLSPDMLLLGKGLTAGYVPGAALAISGELFTRFRESPAQEGFPVGSTADGHPLAMAAGLAVVEALQGTLLDHVIATGGRLLERLRALGSRHECIREARGMGLMIGIELRDRLGRPWSDPRMNRLRLAMEELGILVHPIYHCLTIVPPLVIEDTDCDQIVDALGQALLKVGC